MEDVLELYAQPHDPRRPTVCFDECSKELHGHVAAPVPPAPGSPGKEDAVDEFVGFVAAFAE